MRPLQVYKPWNVDILRNQKTDPSQAHLDMGPKRARYGAVRPGDILPVYTSSEKKYKIIDLNSWLLWWQLAQMSIHQIRSRQVSLNKPGCKYRPKVAFCACWCPTFTVMWMIWEPSFAFLLEMSHRDAIRDTWDNQVFTIAHMVIGLSLPIHRCIHLSYPSLSENKHMRISMWQTDWVPITVQTMHHWPQQRIADVL